MHLAMCYSIATSVTIVGMFGRGGEFSEFGKSSAIQLNNLKPSKIVVTINNLLTNLFIHQTFLPKPYYPLLPNINTAKLFHYTYIDKWEVKEWVTDKYSMLHRRRKGGLGG